MRKGLLLFGLAVGIGAVGCDFSGEMPQDGADNETGAARSDAPAASGEGGSDSSGAPNLSSVVFLHGNVSNWEVTGTLRSVSVSGNSITLDYDKARVWPGRNTAGASVNANPWILVNRNGTWYAATWEWLRVGQTSKSRAAVRGDHINVAPLNNFVPRSGETYGFMVSGLARSNVRNVLERTNVVMFTWP